MSRVATFFVAAVVIGLFTSGASAQGTNVWAKGYPQTGGTAGTIVVQGTVIPDKGWTAASTGTVQCWPVGSGEILTYTIPVGSGGNWQATVSGLTPGVNYNVVVQVNVTSGAKVYTVATDPKQTLAGKKGS